jgi:hypothetical protein
VVGLDEGGLGLDVVSEMARAVWVGGVCEFGSAAAGEEENDAWVSAVGSGRGEYFEEGEDVVGWGRESSGECRTGGARCCVREWAKVEERGVAVWVNVADGGVEESAGMLVKEAVVGVVVVCEERG